MMKRALSYLLCGLLILSLAGCRAGSSSTVASSEVASSADWDYAPGEGENNGNSSTSLTTTTATGGNSSVYQNSDAKLIRRAELNIQTTEFDAATAALDELVERCGGYYESASVYGGSYRNANARRSGEYIIRVPAEQFTAFRNSAGEIGYVTSATESSENVGESYYDTQARLTAQRTKQERLLALMEQAESMEDIIALESALTDVEYQIEQLSTTLNHYDALINFSTITLYLNEVVKVTEEVGQSDSLGQRMAAGFAASGEGLVRGTQEFLIWVSYHIVFTVVAVAILGAGAYVGVKEFKKVRRGKSAPVNEEKNSQ